MSNRGNPNWKKGVSGNPSGGRHHDAAQNPMHMDTWTNVLSGMGTSAYDRRLATTFCADPVPFNDALELYRGDPMAARMVEIVPDEIVRPGFKVNVAIAGDGKAAKQISERIEERWDELCAIEYVHQEMCYSRAYGGGVALLNVNDGAKDLSEPLMLDKVSEFNSITPLEPREMFPIAWYNDPNQPKFGRAALYMLAPLLPGPSFDPVTNTQIYKPMGLTKIHESRLIVFSGPRVTRVPLRGQLFGWGDNLFTRTRRALADFNTGNAGTAVLIDNFAPAVIQIEDLAKMIAEDNTQLFKARIMSIAMAQSALKMTLLDKTEDYKRVPTPVTGFSDLTAGQAKHLAAVIGVPFSIMFGESPGGLNAPAASDTQLEIHYSRMGTQRKRSAIPALTKITQLIIAAEKIHVDRMSVEGNNYSSPSAKEEAETRKLNSDVDMANMDRGVYSAVEVRRRYEGDQYDEGALHVEAPDTNEITTPGDDDVAAYKAEQDPKAQPQPIAGATPAPVAGAAGAPDIQKQAMNGAQVTSLIEVVTSVANGTIARESGRGILKIAFQLTDVEADELLGPEGFEPTKPPAPPSPFGAKPGVPGAVTPPTAPAKPAAPTPPAETKPGA